MTDLVVVAVIVAAVAGQPASRFDRDVVRLRAHFAQVDRELRERDVSHLTAAQQQARAIHIARLREYAARGVFPKNTRHPGAFVPYFVDDVGTRCAMAFLIEQSGAGDYVARVATRSNNAYIAEIARDPELGKPLSDWLEANGLSPEEAARIQPSYDGGGCVCIPEDPAPKVATSYKVGSGASVVTGLSTVAINASLVRLGFSRRAGGWVGLGVGVAGLALAASAMDKGEQYGTLRMVNTGVGVLAAGIGLYAILSRGPSPEPQVAAAPWVSPDGRSGVQLHLRF